MRIKIEGIPLTDEVAKCLVGDVYEMLVEKGCGYASIHKYIDPCNIPDDFVEILTAILKLPDNNREPVSIGFK